MMAGDLREAAGMADSGAARTTAAVRATIGGALALVLAAGMGAGGQAAGATALTTPDPAGMRAATVAPAWVSWVRITDATAAGALRTMSYAARTDGTARTALAAADAMTAVDTSDDGRVTAYVTQMTTQGQSPRRGLTVIVAGEDRRVLGQGATGRPDVTADGRFVAVGTRAGSVLRYDVAAGTTRILCRACTGLPVGFGQDREIANVALAPDGRAFAVLAWAGDAEALVLRRTSDGRALARTTFGEGEPDSGMAWTADSTRLAFPRLDYAGSRPAWRIALLGVGGRLTSTSVSVPPGQLLSGPSVAAGAWWFVRTTGPAPSAARATVLRTTSLSTPARVVGSFATGAQDRSEYVGHFLVTGARPADLP